MNLVCGSRLAGGAVTSLSLFFAKDLSSRSSASASESLGPRASVATCLASCTEVKPGEPGNLCSCLYDPRDSGAACFLPSGATRPAH